MTVNSITNRLTILLIFLSACLMSKAEENEYTGPEYEAHILRYDSDKDIAELESKGVIILRKRGNLLLTYIPVEATRSGRTIRKSTRPRNTPTMDKARSHFDAFKIHTGEGLPRAYTGKGVVVGLCDIGFDPSHPTFLTSDGSRNRIALVTQYIEERGERIVLDTEEKMLDWETDNYDQNHATHVAGIMTGAYKGNDYYGMAPDAEIVATTSQLTDVGLLAGCEDIIEYAKSVGKPAVINLSVGSYNGPHDGTSLFCQYLDMLADEAIICLSAGNEGGRTNTLPYTFSSDSDSFQVRLANYEWTQFYMRGLTDIWSTDATPMSYQLCIYDEVEKQTVHKFPATKPEESVWSVSSNPESDNYSEDFAKYFEGEVVVTSGIYDANSRYFIDMEYDAHTYTNSTAGPWARYNLSFIITGKEGAHADVYADGQYTFLKPVPGGVAPGSRLSFSDLATGHKTISVGMYGNRTKYPSLTDGEAEYTDTKEMEVSGYSGYATLVDKRVMPLTVAPGAVVISSGSTPFVEYKPMRWNNMAVEEEIDGRNRYWYMNVGTSMSCPYVAGTIATWLEACPTLKAEDVISLIEASNTHDYPDPGNPRHGRGWFNPYEGLKKLTGKSGITGGSIENKPSAVYDNGIIKVFNPSAGNISVSLLGIDGRLLHSRSISDSYSEIATDFLPKGVCVVRITSDSRESFVLKAII